jgi:signal transduction histidine kinase
MLSVNRDELVYIVLPHIIAVAIIVFSTVFILVKAKRNRTTIAFANTQVVLCLWMLAKILKTISPTPSLRWACVAAEYYWTAFIGVTVFLVAYAYAFSRPMNVKIKIFLYILPLIMGTVAATNPIHKMIYPDFNKSEFVFGPFFHIHMGIIYSLLLVSVLIILYRLIRNFRQSDKVRTILFFFIIMVPWIINSLFVSGKMETLFGGIGIEILFDITPLAASTSIFVFVYMIYKYDFIDMMPIMKENILQIIDKGIVILGYDGKIINYNITADEIFGFSEYNKEILNYLNVTSYENRFNEILAQLENDKDSYEVKLEGKFYEVRIKDLERYGKVFIFTDIDEYVKLRLEQISRNQIVSQANYELKAKIKLSKQVAIINARNTLARELHDVLGHSIIVSIKLLEVVKIQCQNDQNKLEENKGFVKEKLNQAITLTTNSYKEIIKSMMKDQENTQTMAYHSKHLKKELEKLIEVINKANVQITLNYQDEPLLISQESYKTIKRIVQEGITNAIRHGNASKIDIAISQELNFCTIDICDNGIGCEQIVFGNGLNGMKQRVKNLNGSFACRCSKTDGFSLHIKLCTINS